MQLIEAREHSTAKNHSRAPVGAREGKGGGGGAMLAVASFCGGVCEMFPEIFVTSFKTICLFY